MNFKTYEQGTGERALALGKIIRKVGEETNVPIFILAQTTDIFRLSEEGMNVWAQHADAVSSGKNTESVSPSDLIAAGARGTMLNHSEHKLTLKVIGETIDTCREAKLSTLVGCASLEEGKAVAALGPDFLFYEPPELIGSRDLSVATAEPGIIKSFAENIKNIPFLVGAGIHCAEDVRVSLKLGAVGVLVATDIVLAENPEKELLELASAFAKSGVVV